MTVQRQQEREQERGSLLGSDKNNNNDNDNETIRNQHGYDEYVTTDDNDNDNDEDNDNDDNEHSHSYSSPSVWSHRNVILLKCLSVGVILYTAALMAYAGWGNNNNNSNSNSNKASNQEQQQQQRQRQRQSTTQYRRRLTAVMGDVIPSYMNDLNEDLRARQKLFADTPPEEVKYWFEYTGPLQKYFYRFSKSRGKADYFEGRDDSGVTSGRFTTEFLGGSNHNTMWNGAGAGAGGGAKPKTKPSKPGSNQHTMQYRLLENCLAMGSPKRPDTTTALWKEWYGANDGSGNGSGSGLYPHAEHGDDRCRILFTLNTVGAGRGTTMLWETSPPGPPNAQGPPRWVSEQETAATHLSKQLSEIDAMCATSQVAASVQVLVCEPIDAVWTEWMDGLLPHCGGRRQTKPKSKTNAKPNTVEERPSPVQVVVVATMDSAETCHDLKSGFMEQRTQDLILAPPYLGEKKAGSSNNNNNNNKDIDNPAIKQTHPDLVSSDDHDLYVGLKWTSLVTLRAVNSFLQASADIAAGASAPINNSNDGNSNNNSKEEEETTVVVSNAPASPFLVPSFVRVSYVSEENAKVAKWRMHGDFFHPAAWEICKDSFEVTWINHSLSGPGGVNGLCYEASTQSAMKRRLEAANNEKDSASASGTDCGQWWVYMTELQMPTSPDVFANEITPPVVQGGSNFVWMLTEHQRRAVVSRQVCLHKKSKTKNNNKKKQEDGKDDGSADEDHADDAGCPPPAHAIMPLGDLESFLINYSPNTALGKKHIQGRRPGYSREHEREAERELVRERKQLKGQDDIEEALFDYTIYPAALFRKDATLKAARARDAVLTEEHAVNGGDGDGGDSDKAAAAAEPLGPRFIKSGYYDVTVTKPRPPLLGWCQAIARKGLCTLYADYFRTSTDVRCLEACGMKKNFTPIVS